jgi:hypothetical protein
LNVRSVTVDCDNFRAIAEQKPEPAPINARGWRT